MRRAARFIPPIPVAILILAAAGAVLAADAPTGGAARFAGSAACRPCHENNYRLWSETLHANVIRDAKKKPEVVLGDFSAAEGLGFKKEDILYTIGSHWDQRYMTMMNGELYVLPKLWAVQSKQWRPYNVFSWNKRPWSRYCAGCHVTGYRPGQTDFQEMLIGCESCHGPGEVHAASRKPEDIVNPAKLAPDYRDMICAACHVRGKDLSGQYYFPLGYRPGMDLGQYYFPIDMEEGESTSAAIKRLYTQWARDREESGRGKCEVCGIYGSSDKLKDNLKASEDIMAYCLKCHEFGDKLSSHTRHPGDLKLVCLDCHRAKPFTVEKEKVDVHSVRYYRIHQESCYDEEVDKACVACHAHQGNDRAWAAKEIANGWKSLPALDH